VDFALDPGSVHAVVGENGAGKSTLLRALVGLVRAEGSLEALGRTGFPRGPAEAEARGIAFVPQELSLVPDLSVAEHVTLGREPRGRFGTLKRAERDAQAQRQLARLDGRLPLASRVRSLGAPHAKLVQIARALAANPRVLLLDEPTAALDRPGVAALARLLREHVASGGAAVLVSHRVEEVLAAADRVTVLRDGLRVSCDASEELTAELLIERMVGRELPREPPAAPARSGEPALIWTGPISLELRAGEIVGLAGLVGSGRSELLEAIALERSRDVALVPEERARKALVPTACLRENLLLPAPSAWLRAARERATARRWIERLAIRASGPEARISALSGGNQQKVILARALEKGRAVLLLDEPTQGVDVAAKLEIHARIRAAARAGTAVLLASSDLPELLELAQRILVLRDGRLAGELRGDGRSETRVLALAAGVAS
jgi:ABC-type sugar transport system ATPase subunit